MSWLFQLGIAVVLVGIAAVTGAKPEEGRPVARTQLMTVARVILVVGALVFAGLGIFGGLAG